MTITVEMLEARRKELQEELELLDKMLAIRKGHSIDTPAFAQKITAKSYSVRGRVVDAAIELIHNSGRQVGNQEILDYLEKKGISLGDTKNKKAMLAAILSQEVRKKTAKLRKVARGIFDIKQ
jgi:uncharacterized protein YjbK